MTEVIYIIVGGFIKLFPKIVDTACQQSDIMLLWSHYRTLLQAKDQEIRTFYL